MEVPPVRHTGYRRLHTTATTLSEYLQECVRDEEQFLRFISDYRDLYFQSLPSINTDFFIDINMSDVLYELKKNKCHQLLGVVYVLKETMFMCQKLLKYGLSNFLEDVTLYPEQMNPDRIKLIGRFVCGYFIKLRNVTILWKSADFVCQGLQIHKTKLQAAKSERDKLIRETKSKAKQVLPEPAYDSVEPSNTKIVTILTNLRRVIEHYLMPMLVNARVRPEGILTERSLDMPHAPTDTNRAVYESVAAIARLLIDSRDFPDPVQASIGNLEEFLTRVTEWRLEDSFMHETVKNTSKNVSKLVAMIRVEKLEMTSEEYSKLTNLISNAREMFSLGEFAANKAKDMDQFRMQQVFRCLVEHYYISLKEGDFMEYLFPFLCNQQIIQTFLRIYRATSRQLDRIEDRLKDVRILQ
ncbi:hypothetical protein NPIL_108691 [Nephila pilipes]|uniref:Uncharacterized protein n=1 Tax=Nephila pilipes TaxID=299642 RepID=A0A8X6N4Y6_NEPPI|nr:hypothetical protein NPIL_108691 [Nephila pilipes]